MVEIYNLPSYYHLSTTCITRLILAKLILFFSFFTEPWITLNTLLGHILRSVPGLETLNLSMIPVLTPLLSAEMIADTMVMMGLCWKSRMCLLPWLSLNMLGVLVTAFSLVANASSFQGGVDGVDEQEKNLVSQIHLMMCCLCLSVLLCMLCQQYSLVIEIYFHLHRNIISRKDDSLVLVNKLEKGQIYSPVPSNMFKNNQDKNKTVSLYPQDLLSAAQNPPPAPASHTTTLQRSFQNPPSTSNSTLKRSFNPSPPPSTNNSTLQRSFNPSPPPPPQSNNTNDLNNINNVSQSTNISDDHSNSSSIRATRNSFQETGSSLPEVRNSFHEGGSCATLPEDSLRNSWNTFKFSFDDDKFS